jgi:hypothetical protein
MVEFERICREYIKSQEEYSQLERRTDEQDPSYLKALEAARARVAEKKREYDRLVRVLRGGCHL